MHHHDLAAGENHPDELTDVEAIGFGIHDPDSDEE